MKLGCSFGHVKNSSRPEVVVDSDIRFHTGTYSRHNRIRTWRGSIVGVVDNSAYCNNL